MKVFRLATLMALYCVLAPVDVIAGSDPCASAPCLNGGSCNADGFLYSCSCAAGFIGPTCSLMASGDEYVDVSYNGSSGGSSNRIGWWQNPLGPSGAGQTFRTDTGGMLLHVFLSIYIRQEAIDEDENLLVEFWNVDNSGLPIGSPLAAYTVLASSFPGPDIDTVQSIDFSSDRIFLQPSTQYAFTMSVANNADTEFSGMYGYTFNSGGTPYDGGPGLNRTGNNDWYSSSQLNRFEVTVFRALYEDGFEN